MNMCMCECEKQNNLSILCPPNIWLAQGSILNHIERYVGQILSFSTVGKTKAEDCGSLL